MRTSPPEHFDVEQFYRGIYLFQRWELFPGVSTAGPKDVVRTLDAMNFPQSLAGKRVLDIAPWNGFFSFECARRDAAEVVSLGPEDPTDTGFEQTRVLLGLDNVRYVRAGVYELPALGLGTFDVVLFLGLIYHLRHPLLALDLIHDACRDQLYVDTPFLDNTILDRTVPDETRAFLLANRAVIHQLPLLYFTEGAETGDPFNWFIPNLRAFAAFVRSSGFEIASQADDGGGWTWIAARKGMRPFQPGGLEGYNPAAARR